MIDAAVEEKWQDVADVLQGSGKKRSYYPSTGPSRRECIRHKSAFDRFVEDPEDAGDFVIRKILAQYVLFGSREVACFTILHGINWVQVKKESVAHIRSMDDCGTERPVVDIALERPGVVITLGDENVANSMALLVSPSEHEKIPQCAHLKLNYICEIYRRSKTTSLLKPSRWGFPIQRGCPLIEDLCQFCTTEDRFILKVCKDKKWVHCVAVRNNQIRDTTSDDGWLPLTPASFTLLHITRITGGLKISEKK